MKYDETRSNPGMDRKEKIMNVVITGKLSKPRDELVKEFAGYGISVMAGMKPNIDYLITDTPNSGTRKNQMARSFGTKIVSELEFRMTIKYTKPPLIVNTTKLKSSNIPPKQATIEATLPRYLDF